MNYDTYRLCGVALIAAVSALLLRNIKREFEVPLQIAGSAALIGAALLMAEPAIVYAVELMGASGLAADAAGTLIKMLGIVWITKISTDICREMGATGVANSLELAAKLEIVILTLPLISSVLESVGGLLGEAGL